MLIFVYWCRIRLKPQRPASDILHYNSSVCSLGALSIAGLGTYTRHTATTPSCGSCVSEDVDHDQHATHLGGMNCRRIFRLTKTTSLTLAWIRKYGEPCILTDHTKDGNHRNMLRLLNWTWQLPVVSYPQMNWVWNTIGFTSQDPGWDNLCSSRIRKEAGR